MAGSGVFAINGYCSGSEKGWRNAAERSFPVRRVCLIVTGQRLDAALFAAIIDDEMAKIRAGAESLAYPEPYAGEVADLVTGGLRGRETADERTALVFAGLGLADVAVAAAVYQRAVERGIGRVLPL